MALGDDSVSVKHLVCCVTLFKGRLTRLTLFRVAVNQGSTLRLSTTFGEDRGAKAAANAGSSTVGIILSISSYFFFFFLYFYCSPVDLRNSDIKRSTFAGIRELVWQEIKVIKARFAHAGRFPS